MKDAFGNMEGEVVLATMEEQVGRIDQPNRTTKSHKNLQPYKQE